MAEKDLAYEAVLVLLDQAEELARKGEIGAAIQVAEHAHNLAVVTGTLDGKADAMIRLMKFERARFDLRRSFRWAIDALGALCDPSGEGRALPGNRPRSRLIGACAIFLASAVAGLGEVSLAQALSMLDKLELEHTPTSRAPGLLFARAIILDELGRVREAIDAAEQTLASRALFPCPTCVRTVLARLHHRAGEAITARAMLGAIRGDCNYSEVERRVLLGRLALGEGDFACAMREAQGAIDAASHNTSGSPYDPIHPRVEAFSIVIAAHRATGQGERAREAARRMLEHGVDTVGPLSRWRALFTAIEVAADDRDRAWADALLDEAGALAPRLDEQRESTAHADALRNMGRRVAAWA